MAEMIIKASGVCKGYGSKQVLHDVNFTINKGDIYGLVGKNGAGKTTIMRILTGLQNPKSGTIEYGFDNKRLGSVGALVELPSIYSNMSAEENIRFQYLNLGLKTDDSIKEILKLVGLDNTGNKHAGKFSLGMRQRLGIAMAMVGDPEVLILDEPINGLDPQGIIGVRDLLIRLNREKGITIKLCRGGAGGGRRSRLCGDRRGGRRPKRARRDDPAIPRLCRPPRAAHRRYSQNLPNGARGQSRGAYHGR